MIKYIYIRPETEVVHVSITPWLMAGSEKLIDTGDGTDPSKIHEGGLNPGGNGKPPEEVASKRYDLWDSIPKDLFGSGWN